jgi:hypothetical protein
VCAGLHRDWMNVCFFLILLKKGKKEKERNLIIKREFLSLFKRPFLDFFFFFGWLFGKFPIQKPREMDIRGDRKS